MGAAADDEALRAYYELDREAGRLERGVGLLELERTKEIVSRHLPDAPAVIADIGGGTGPYAEWLAGLGHRVVLRDVMEHHIAHARQRLAGLDVDVAVGDARDVDLPDASVDAVLLLGPLYHLRARRDRLAALREAARIVRPGGHVFAAAISRWSTRLDGVARHLVTPTGPVVELLDGLERSGWMPPQFAGSFSAFTHRPGQLRAEVSAAGLVDATVVAVEGIGAYFADIDARMADPDGRAVLLATARATEAVPELVGLGAHLLATARRPRHHAS